MGKCFRFLGCFGLVSVCAVSYGVYPPAKELLRQLCGKNGLDSTFKQAFWDVREEALYGGFENFPILGEKQGLITSFDKDLEPFGTSVSQKEKINGIWGEFSWKLNGTEISKAEQIRSVIEKENLSLSKEGLENLTKVCQTLLSERFAENLLGKKAVYALYGYCKEKPYSSFSVNFDRYTYDEKPGVFEFRILYSQQHQSGQTFMIGFRFWYNVENDPYGLQKDCFAISVWDRVKKCDVPYRVEVDCFWINDYQIRLHISGLMNEDLLRASEEPREIGEIDVYPGLTEDEKDMTETVSKKESASKLSQSTQKSSEQSKDRTGNGKHKKKRHGKK